MYYFEDTTVANHIDEPRLPISAMNYDGIFLEDGIKGFRTLSVTGREMLSVDIQSDNANIGSFISAQRLPSRVLKVTYQIQNADSEQILINYRKMMAYLFKEKDVPIYFNDEKDVVYYGRYSSGEEVPGDRHSLTSSFEIFCADPRKYSLKVFTIEDKNKVNGYFLFKTKPLKIEVQIEKNDGVLISNGVQQIKITKKSLKPNDLVIFDFIMGKVLVNGVNRTNWLDLTSDFENFELKNNQTITCTNGKALLTFKEASL